MNNKFWREIFDQITSLVMIFRMQGDLAELMFVNKSVNAHLGYSPETFVMESEQDGDLRTRLNKLVKSAIDDNSGVVLTDLAGRKVAFRIEMKSFYSDAIKEDLAIITLYPDSATQELKHEDNPVVAESIVMKSVLERLRKLQEAGANMAFIGGIGTGKRLMMDRILRSVMDVGDSIWRLDYADAKKPSYRLDGVQADMVTLQSTKLRKNTTVFIYDMDHISKSDQDKLMGFIESQEGYLRFVCGSGESPDAMVAAGRLIPELYYKLNTISIVLPTLNMRRVDIKPYSERWIERMCNAAGLEMPVVTDKEWTRLFHHEFKESFDELNAILKRSLLKWNGEKFNVELDMVDIRHTMPEEVKSTGRASIVLEYGSTHDEHMHEYLRQIMDRCGWKIYGSDGAASRLDMKPTTLQSKLEKYGVIRH